MDDSRQVVGTGAESKLSREQKAGLIFVLVIGLGTLVLGGQYLWTHMAAPFSLSYTGPRLELNSEKDSAEVAKQKTTDTDTDGISDYDELHIYSTSPYLNDSDSDGLADGIEVSSGQDPNCASGSACGSVANEGVVLPGGTDGLDEQGAALSAREQELQQAVQALSSLSPADIRDLLVSSGAGQAEIDAMTDDQVNVLYQNLLTQLTQQGALDSLIPPDAGTDSAPVTPIP